MLGGFLTPLIATREVAFSNLPCSLFAASCSRLDDAGLGASVLYATLLGTFWLSRCSLILPCLMVYSSKL